MELNDNEILQMNVVHHQFGPGTLIKSLGDVAQVDFFGDVIEVNYSELTVDAPVLAPVSSQVSSVGRVNLRRAYEAINLGVVPPNPDQLLAVSINGPAIDETCRSWLDRAPKDGLSKVFFGNYGSGKSHHLRFCEAVALKTGWVVSFVEFDPKQADPAKPHLVYSAIMNSMKFPSRVDGSSIKSIFDLVGEIRKSYDRIAKGPYFKASPWFKPTLAGLRFLAHRPDSEYLEVLSWLTGQYIAQPSIRRTLKFAGSREYPPSMPRIRETAEIYVFNLVVVNEILKALGFKGLLLILDEAEHVRGYTVPRRERANNFFDLLARSARPYNKTLEPPVGNDHDYDLPKSWMTGPHFGLLVGLTEGSSLSADSGNIRDECVFLDKIEDAVKLIAPAPDHYERWCLNFLDQFYEHYPAEMHMLKARSEREKVAELLAVHFARQPEEDRTLRVWTKLGTLAPSILMANGAESTDHLHELLSIAARSETRELMEWDL